MRKKKRPSYTCVCSLQRIAFGYGSASERLTALERFDKIIGLVKPKEVPQMERSGYEISNEIHRRPADLLD